eukprot:GEMP01042281.1.p1 GENE.GEMP01042281.1~~GEMP01042281.1.p1  ORF type:complete len:479 (+),score=9.62 GEMP01042281.1:141-1577(+)
MFAPFVPKFGPWHASRRLIVCAYPSRCNLPLPVTFNAVRRIAFGRLLDDKVKQLPLPTFLPHGSKRDLERISILEMKVEDARKPRDRSLYQKPAKREERMDSEGNLRCTKCGVFRTISSFYMNPRNKCGHSCYCKLCHGKMKLYYYAHTLRGIMTTFLGNAKSNSARRSTIPGRENAGRFEIDVPFLLNLWLKQKGRCAYSDIVMNIEPWTPWKLSLERQDNALGYVPGNVVFACAEFNTVDHTVNAKGAVHGSSKWSREKVRSVPETVRSSLPLSDSEFVQKTECLDATATRNKYSKRQVLDNGNILCPSCNRFLSPDNFHFHRRNTFGRQHICKPCSSSYLSEYRNTLIGFLRSRLHSVKQSAKVRSDKGRGEAGDFNMTLADVLMLYKKQRGLCYYASVKMTLKPRSDWMCSIERLDNSKGYVHGNVALICCEFQTSDYSCRATAPVFGSPQWSKHKVAMVIQWLKSKNAALHQE